MFGLGTIINVVCVIVGGIVGIIAGKKFSQSMQDTLMQGIGVCVLFVSIVGVIQRMMYVGADGHLESQGTMMLIISIAIGTVIGELLKLERLIVRFGEWLKIKTGNSKDKMFVDAFVTTSVTICVGAMAVVGSIQDGIYGDYTVLAAKALLDLIIVMVMASTMGKGCAFAAIPVAIFQGVITIAAHFIGSFVSDGAVSNLSLVGSAIIFCVGINIVWDKKIKVANMLPALIIAVLFHTFGL